MNRRSLLYSLVAIGAVALLAGFGLSATHAATSTQTQPPLSQQTAAQLQTQGRTSGTFTAPPPPALPYVTLYDQLNNAGANATLSQNFGDFPSYSSQTADDFPVPGGQNWQVNEVDAQGAYFNGPGNATSFNVYFYTSVVSGSYTIPGTPVYSATAQTYISTTGTFSISLSTPALLVGGATYYLSVQANMNFTPNGEWGWQDRTVQSNGPAAWRNAGGGFGTACNNWDRRTFCVGDPSAADQMFRLVGNVVVQGTSTPTVTGTPSTATRTATVAASATRTTVPTATSTGGPAGTPTCIPAAPILVGGGVPAQSVNRIPANALARPAGNGSHGGHAQGVLNPNAPISFQLDDGSYENSIGFGTSSTENAAIWLNRFTPPSGSYPIYLQHISIEWPTESGGSVVGLHPRLLVYLDADGDGDPSNAVLLGQTTVTIGALNVFESYPINIVVPGPGDLYLGFEDAWAENPYTPKLHPAAIDTTASQQRSWLAAQSSGAAPDYTTLGNNDTIGLIDDFGLPGNWLIRADGQTGAVACASATATVVLPTATATRQATSVPSATATQQATTVPSATSTSVPTSPTATETACPINFSDVHPTDYFYEPVQYLYCHGVISGYGDGTFRPYADTTRAQMVKIVVLGFGIAVTTPAGGAYTFHDVPPGAPFFDVIETAAAHQIISGYTCGPGGPGPCDPQNRPYFLPNNSVTRGQLSKIDTVAAGWPQLNPATPTFTDVPRNSTFYTYIETAVCHGVVSGYADHTFRPFANATRGQIAKIVYLSIIDQPGSCALTPTATPAGR